MVKESGAGICEGYATPKLVTCRPYPLFGKADAEGISSSHIERQYLAIRVNMRRLTRLSNAFSKKLDNLEAAAALHLGHYNFCRTHGTLCLPLAMAAGVTDTPWIMPRWRQIRTPWQSPPAA